MSTDTPDVEEILSKHFLQNYPIDAARHIESMELSDIILLLGDQPAEVLLPVWTKLVPRFAATLTTYIPNELAKDILTQIPPDHAVIDECRRDLGDTAQRQDENSALDVCC